MKAIACAIMVAVCQPFAMHEGWYEPINLPYRIVGDLWFLGFTIATIYFLVRSR
jgi:hypothetical protein